MIKNRMDFIIFSANKFNIKMEHSQKSDTPAKMATEDHSKMDHGSMQHVDDPNDDLAEILFITSYPPRECGIATYSQDLIKALNNKFSNSFSFKVCAMESGNAKYLYPPEEIGRAHV